MTLDTPPTEHGMGCLPSPPDDRDYPIDDLYALSGIQVSTPPAVYAIPNLSSLPVLDQGISPECVAFAHSSLKAYEDRKDQGKYFNFNEPYFFQLIGGNQYGAVIRNALTRLLGYGYPVVTTDDAAHHKIKAYYAVPKDIAAIKNAVMAFGPVIMGLHWYSSWSSPYGNGKVPAPFGTVGGHAIQIVGWNDAMGSFRCRNTWGPIWGVSGDCYIPYSYVMNYAFEFWKAVDQIVTPTQDAFEGYRVTIEKPVTLTTYVVGSNCALTPRKISFPSASHAPVTRGTCGGRVYWRTADGPKTGLSYICGMTENGWHISRVYKKPTGTIYERRIVCTAW